MIWFILSSNSTPPSVTPARLILTRRLLQVNEVSEAISSGYTRITR